MVVPQQFANKIGNIKQTEHASSQIFLSPYLNIYLCTFPHLLHHTSSATWQEHQQQKRNLPPPETITQPKIKRPRTQVDSNKRRESQPIIHAAGHIADQMPHPRMARTMILTRTPTHKSTALTLLVMTWQPKVSLHDMSVVPPVKRRSTESDDDSGKRSDKA